MTRSGLTKDQLENITDRLSNRRDAVSRGDYGVVATEGYRTAYADALNAVVQAASDVNTDATTEGLTGAGLQKLKSFISDRLDSARADNDTARAEAYDWAQFVVDYADDGLVVLDSSPAEKFAAELTSYRTELLRGTGPASDMTALGRLTALETIADILERTSRLRHIPGATSVQIVNEVATHVRNQMDSARRVGAGDRWATLANVQEILENLNEEPDEPKHDEGLRKLEDAYDAKTAKLARVRHELANTRQVLNETQQDLDATHMRWLALFAVVGSVRQSLETRASEASQISKSILALAPNSKAAVTYSSARASAFSEALKILDAAEADSQPDVEVVS